MIGKGEPDSGMDFWGKNDFCQPMQGEIQENVNLTGVS